MEVEDLDLTDQPSIDEGKISIFIFAYHCIGAVFFAIPVLICVQHCCDKALTLRNLSNPCVLGLFFCDFRFNLCSALL